jgi:hypothetical protein
MLDVFLRPPGGDSCGIWILRIIDPSSPALGPDDDTEDMLVNVLEDILAEDVFAADKTLFDGTDWPKVSLGLRPDDKNDNLSGEVSDC